MTRICRVHLGMHKTGSTSIQHAMAGYEDAGLRYLDLGDPNQSHALVNLFSDPSRPLAFNSAQGLTGTALDAHMARLRSRLEAELTRDDRDVVISGEALGTMLTPAEVAGMVEHLRDRFDEVTGLAYLRGPRSFMRSEMQQVLKGGNLVFEPKVFYPRYAARFAKWDSALGPGKLHLVAFDDRLRQPGALVADFTRRVGADGSRIAEPRLWANRGLSAEALALVCTGHSRRDALQAEGLGLAEDKSLIALLDGFGDGVARPDPAATDAQLQASAVDLDWITARFGAPLPDEDDPGHAVTFDGMAAVERLARGCLDAAMGWIDEPKGRDASQLSGRSFLGRVLVRSPAPVRKLDPLRMHARRQLEIIGRELDR